MVANKRVIFHVGALVCVGALMIFFGPENSLDAKIYYTGEEAREFLKGLGDGQSDSYFINELLDLLFIFLYSTLAFISARRIFKTLAFAPWFALVPGVFDLIETSTILFILKVGDTLLALDNLGLVTFLKWATGVVLVVLALVKISIDKGWWSRYYWRPFR